MYGELIKKLEPWDISEEDIRVETFKKYIGAEYYNRGVRVELKDYDMSVSSFNEKSQRANLKRCFEMIETILLNYML